MLKISRFGFHKNVRESLKKNVRIPGFSSELWNENLPRMDPWRPGDYSFNSSPGDSEVDQLMKARGMNLYLKEANVEQTITKSWLSVSVM